MIKINLLPAEALKKRSETDLIVIGGSIGILIVVIFFSLFIMRKVKLSFLEKKVREAENEKQKYQAIVQEVERLKTEKSNLEQRRNIIKSLISGRLTYPKLLDAFIASIPQDIWINGCQTTSKGETVEMTITASSFSNYAIADWITTLEDSKTFYDIELGAISSSQQQNQKTKKTQIVLNFQLKCFFRRI